MNGSRKVLFSAILSRLLENLCPRFNIVLIDINKAIQNEENLPYLTLEILFSKFPRVDSFYQKNIEDLSEIAATDIEEIVPIFTKSIKDIINEKVTTFLVIQNCCPSFNGSNSIHSIILYYFSLFFMTDLLCSSISKAVLKNCKLLSSTVSTITRAGHNIAFSKQIVPSVHVNIVKQWSVIFSLLSENHHQEISHTASLFSLSDELTLPILLMRFARLDVNDAVGNIFVDNIIQICRYHAKKKMLTNSVLESLSYMLVTLPYDEDIYQKLFNFANSLKKDHNLRSGRTFLLTQIFLRYPKIRSRSNNFFHRKILKNASNRNNVEFSLRCFELTIMGRNVKYECLFWEWGKNPRATPLSFIQFASNLENNQIEDDSFTSHFMNYFFAKSDFSVCPDLFKNTIIHLASLDFPNFLKNMVTRFLELESHDPRFLVFLSTIPLINSDDFMNHTIYKVTPDDINLFNKMTYSKIYKTMLASKPDTINTKHGVCIRDFNFLLSSLSDESDQKISMILEEWNLHCFGILETDHVRSKPTLDILNLHINLLNTFQYVFSDKDFGNPDVISYILELSCHIENRIASAAYDLCTKYIATQVNANQFIKNAIKFEGTIRDSESAFVVFSLIYSVMKRSYGITEIDIKLLRKIESTSFTLFASTYPGTRSLARGLLYECSKRIRGKSMLTYLKPRITYIEKTAKRKMLLFAIPEKPEAKLPPATLLSFDTALISHFYDVWLFFLAELVNVLVASNFTPFLQFVDKCRDKILNLNENQHHQPNEIGLLIIFLSTQFHLSTLVSSSYIDFSNTYEDFGPEVDKRQEICAIIHDMLESEDERLNDLGFRLIQHLNFSLQPPMIDVLSVVKPKFLGLAIFTVSLLIRMPEVDGSFFQIHMSRLIAFISSVQYHLIEGGLNSTRIIEWSPKDEKNLALFKDLMRDYCIVIMIMFVQHSHEVTEEEWPLSSRQVVIRFFINWATTTLPILESLRCYAAAALVTVTGIGPFFNDTCLFDIKALELFAHLESNGFSIIYNLLHFHTELTLKHFIKVCYSLPRASSDLYFDSLLKVIEKEKSPFFFVMSGQIIFLASVYTYREHPHATDMIKGILGISTVSVLSNYLSPVRMNKVTTDDEKDREKDWKKDSDKEEFNYKNLPNVFQYATEAVFDSFFKVMKMKDRHIPTNDIIEAVRPWIKKIRLLPKQKVCNANVPEMFNFFTPYEFLEKMTEITESVEDDQFRDMVSLWIELGEQPDHYDLIPLYLSEWRNYEQKKRMFEVLLETDSLDLPFRISHRCGFAFYAHYTRILRYQLNDEHKWLSILLANAFHRNWEHMLPLLPKVIHFAFLVRTQGNTRLFDIICRNLKIECYEGSIPRVMMRKVIDQFIHVLNKMSKTIISDWGNEALKWIMGCSSIDFVTTSLLIYNRIMIPFDDSLQYSMMRIASYHISQNVKEIQNEQYFFDFIFEIFYFFNKVYLKNKENKQSNQSIIKFVSAFLDCRVFIDAHVLMETSDLFLNTIRHKEIQDPQMLISMIRPRLTSCDRQNHGYTETISILDEIIKLTHYDELEMIALPVKNLDNSEFKSLSIFSIDDVIERSSDSALCKSLVHYSLMIDNSSYLLHDSIFEITQKVIDRLASTSKQLLNEKFENNKISIAKIYQFACRSMSKCKNAMKLIQSICVNVPNVVMMNVIDVFEWDRSIEDVNRILQIIVKENFNKFPPESSTSNVIITDCQSYKQVENLLFTETPPKILPFAAMDDVIESMKNIRKETARINRTRRGRRKIKTNLSSSPNSVSLVFSGENKSEELLGPLIHPTKLILEDIKHSIPTSHSYQRSTSNLEEFTKVVNKRKISIEKFLKADLYNL
ncbi:hypothetical protein TRFO_37808 [Tritrichomonas foetus]|uniref:Uncharacterized protein n=1 Tax=Tritrichomonas foetus TaxID=1144522 RepID=A0A1J4JF45_9EUKA|nr:hypothetical protein TRFO_37808 [Tritrichomonas foetus]|eukprot:OHS96077.1 hypothetical protein TRFO_37808 [Tritrichomonas foetus]